LGGKGPLQVGTDEWREKMQRYWKMKETGARIEIENKAVLALTKKK
jgi:hypothetical protein